MTATTSTCADVVSSTLFSSLSPSPSNNRFSSSASCTSNFTLASPTPSPSPPTFRPSRRLVLSTDSLTTACHVVPSFLRSAASSSLICRAAPGPWYPNAVYSWTAAAPARANSSASAPEEIPPQPMMGIDAGRSERRVRRVARVYGFKGGPDRPPCSTLFAARTVSSEAVSANRYVHARSDRLDGLWMVVLLTMTPSMPSVARTAAATSATSESLRSGAILTSSFGRCACVDDAVTWSRAEVTPARSSCSNVRLCMPLTNTRVSRARRMCSTRTSTRAYSDWRRSRPARRRRDRTSVRP